MFSRKSLTPHNYAVSDLVPVLRDSCGMTGEEKAVVRDSAYGTNGEMSIMTSAEKIIERTHTLHPAAEYHEDFGPVLWWHVPICEPPYVGYGEGMDTGDTDPCTRLQRSGWLNYWSRLPNVWEDRTEAGRTRRRHCD